MRDFCQSRAMRSCNKTLNSDYWNTFFELTQEDGMKV